MSKHSIILDCDPGIDDAVALALAFSARDELDILAITAVAGNVPLELTARNARVMRQLAGCEDVPVYAGCAAPMVRAPVHAAEFHGETGLGGIEPFAPSAPLGRSHAAVKIVELVRASKVPVQLIATGPLTNIAAALILAPDIAWNIRELVLMGGADTEGGNITPHAEFNVFADPHAAQIVFDKPVGAPLPITVFSLDFTHTVRITQDRISEMRCGQGRLSQTTADLYDAINAFEKTMVGSDAGPLHDPCPVAYALAPHLFHSRKVAVGVDTRPGETFGQTAFSEAGASVNWVIPTKDSKTCDAIFALLSERINRHA